jgi:hypothetical protein
MRPVIMQHHRDTRKMQANGKSSEQFSTDFKLRFIHEPLILNGRLDFKKTIYYKIVFERFSKKCD